MASIPKRHMEEYFVDSVLERTIPIREHDSQVPTTYAPAYDNRLRQQHVTCMDRLLRNELVRHAEKRLEFKQRWHNASQTLHGIDETISLINKPYTDSKHDTMRSIEMAARNNDLAAERHRRLIGQLKEKCYLTDAKNETLERLDKFRVIRDYLDKVVDSSHGEFSSIQQLIDRANLLLDTRKELLRRNERLQLNITRREKELSSHSVVKENEGILLNNYISDVTEDLALAQDERHRLESQLAHVKDTAHHRTMVLGQLRISTFNIFSQICESFGRTPKVRSSDVIGQLEYIKGTLLEVNKLRATINELLAKRRKMRSKSLNSPKRTAQSKRSTTNSTKVLVDGKSARP